MNRLIHPIIACFTLAAMLTACDSSIIEMPSRAETDLTKVTLNCHVLYCDMSDITTEYQSAQRTKTMPVIDGISASLRYLVEFTPEVGTPVRLEFFKDQMEANGLEFSTTLTSQKYTVNVLLEYYYEGAAQTTYFDVADLSAVGHSTRSHSASLDTKDLFANSSKLDLSIYKNDRNADVTHTVTLQRPYSAIRVVSIDYEKFYEAYQRGALATGLPTYCKVMYTTNIPLGYNILTDKPTIMAGEVTTIAECNVLSGSEIQLMKDYILINSTESAVGLWIEIYDDQMRLITSSVVNGDRIVPLRRGHVTTVYSDFFRNTPGMSDEETTDEGRISIDPSFNGDIEVIIND